MAEMSEDMEEQVPPRNAEKYLSDGEKEENGEAQSEKTTQEEPQQAKEDDNNNENVESKNTENEP